MDPNVVNLGALNSWLSERCSSDPRSVDDAVALKSDGSFDVQAPGNDCENRAKGKRVFFHYIKKQLDDNVKLLRFFSRTDKICENGNWLRSYSIQLADADKDRCEIEVSHAKFLVESLMQSPSQRINQLRNDIFELILMFGEAAEIDRKLEELYNYLCECHAKPNRLICVANIYHIFSDLAKDAIEFIKTRDLVAPNQVAATVRISKFERDKEIDLAILKLSEVNSVFGDPTYRQIIDELLKGLGDEVVKEIIYSNREKHEVLDKVVNCAKLLIRQKKMAGLAEQVTTTEQCQPSQLKTPVLPMGPAQSESALVKARCDDVTPSSSDQKYASAIGHTPISDQSSSGARPKVNSSSRSPKNAEGSFSWEMTRPHIPSRYSKGLEHTLRFLSIDGTKYDRIMDINPDLMKAGELDHTLKYDIGLDDQNARLILECMKSPDEIDDLMKAREKADEEDLAKRRNIIALANKGKYKNREIEKFKHDNDALIALKFSCRDITRPEYDVLAVGSQIDDDTGMRFDEHRTVFADKCGHSDFNGDIHITIDQIPAGKKFKEVHFTGLPGYVFNDEPTNLLLFQKVNCLMEDGGKVFVCFGISTEQNYNNSSFMRRVLTPTGFGQLVILEPGPIGVNLSATKVKSIETSPLKGAESSNVNTFSVVEPVSAESQVVKAASQTPVSGLGSQHLQEIQLSQKILNGQIRHIMEGDGKSFDHNFIKLALNNPLNSEFNLTANTWAHLKVRYEEWEKNKHYSRLPLSHSIQDFESRVETAKQEFTARFINSSSFIHIPIVAGASPGTFSHITPPRTRLGNFPERSFRTNVSQVNVSDGGAHNGSMLPWLSDKFAQSKSVSRNQEVIGGDTRPSPRGRIPAVYGQKDLLAKMPSVSSVKTALLHGNEASEDVVNGAGVATKRGLLRPELKRSDFSAAASRSPTPVATLVSADDQRKVRFSTRYSGGKLNDDEMREAIRLGMEPSMFLSGRQAEHEVVVVNAVRRSIDENRRNNSGQQGVVVAQNTRLDSITILKTKLNTEDTTVQTLDSQAQRHQNVFRERLQDLLLLNNRSPIGNDLLAIDDMTPSLAAALQEGKVEGFVRIEEQAIRELSTARYPVTVHDDGRVVLQRAAGIQAEKNNCAVAAVLMALSYRGNLGLIIREGNQLINALDGERYLLNPKMKQQLDRLVRLVRVFETYNEKDPTVLRTNDDMNEIRDIFGIPKGIILDSDEFLEKIITIYRDLRSSCAGVQAGFDVFNLPGEDMVEYSGMSTNEAVGKYYYRELVRELGNLHLNSCAINAVIMMLNRNHFLLAAVKTIQDLKAGQPDFANGKHREYQMAAARTDFLFDLLISVSRKKGGELLSDDDVRNFRSNYDLDPTSVICPSKLLNKIIRDLNLLILSPSVRPLRYDEIMEECECLYQVALRKVIMKYNQSRVSDGKAEQVTSPDILVVSTPSFGFENRANMEISHEITKPGILGKLDRYRLDSVISITSGHYVAWMYDHEQKRLMAADSMSEQLGVNDDEKVVVPAILSMPMEDTRDALKETLKTMNEMFDSPVKDAMTRFEKLRSTFRLAFYRKV